MWPFGQVISILGNNARRPRCTRIVLPFRPYSRFILHHFVRPQPHSCVSCVQPITLIDNDQHNHVLYTTSSKVLSTNLSYGKKLHLSHVPKSNKYVSEKPLTKTQLKVRSQARKLLRRLSSVMSHKQNESETCVKNAKSADQFLRSANVLTTDAAALAQAALVPEPAVLFFSDIAKQTKLPLPDVLFMYETLAGALNPTSLSNQGHSKNVSSSLIVTYLLHECAKPKSKQWQIAAALMNMLQALGVRAERQHFVAALKVMANNFQTDAAADLLQKMLRHGIEPSMSIFHALLKCCAKTGHADHAVQVISTMKWLKISPNFITLTSAMNACVNGGKPLEALDLFDMFVLNEPGLSKCPDFRKMSVKELFNAGKADQRMMTPESSRTHFKNAKEVNSNHVSLSSNDVSTSPPPFMQRSQIR